MGLRGPTSRRHPKRSFAREVIVPGVIGFVLLGLLWVAWRSGLILEGATALISLLQPK